MTIKYLVHKCSEKVSSTGLYVKEENGAPYFIYRTQELRAFVVTPASGQNMKSSFTETLLHIQCSLPIPAISSFLKFEQCHSILSRLKELFFRNPVSNR